MIATVSLCYNNTNLIGNINEITNKLTGNSKEVKVKDCISKYSLFAILNKIDVI